MFAFTNFTIYLFIYVYISSNFALLFCLIRVCSSKRYFINIRVVLNEMHLQSFSYETWQIRIILLVFCWQYYAADTNALGLKQRSKAFIFHNSLQILSKEFTLYSSFYYFLVVSNSKPGKYITAILIHSFQIFL